MTQNTSLSACRGAHVPSSGLGRLAPLRIRSEVRVIVGDPAWVTWDGERPDVVAAVLAVPGAELFEFEGGQWRRHGDCLPRFDLPPPGEAIPLARAVVPAPFQPAEPGERLLRRVPLALVRCEVPRPTSALRCSLRALRWVQSL